MIPNDDDGLADRFASKVESLLGTLLLVGLLLFLMHSAGTTTGDYIGDSHAVGDVERPDSALDYYVDCNGDGSVVTDDPVGNGDRAFDYSNGDDDEELEKSRVPWSKLYDPADYRSGSV